MNAHIRQIRAASRHIERARKQLALAYEERRLAIRNAYTAGLTSEQISRAANITADRALQIKAGTRGGPKHTCTDPEPLL